MNGKVGKVWGTTECKLSTPFVHGELLHIKPWHQCSLHVHRRKRNAFMVVKGRLFIDVVKNDYPLTDTTELGPGEITDVAAGEHHRFRTESQSCVCFEFYHPEPMSDDIERKGHGGKIERYQKKRKP